MFFCDVCYGYLDSSVVEYDYDDSGNLVQIFCPICHEESLIEIDDNDLEISAYDYADFDHSHYHIF